MGRRGLVAPVVVSAVASVRPPARPGPAAAPAAPEPADPRLPNVSLSELEIASGLVLGHCPTAAEQLPPSGSPLAALQDAVLPALLRTPCMVSFSGGMDSSFVLAVATHTARQHGLPDPIPITWRCPDAPLSWETYWQEKVLADLGLRGHLVLEATDELDFVGPVAARQLRRHGLLYPANLHFHLPFLEQATGGALITGAGGDQMLNCWRRPRSRSLPGRLVRDARRAAPESLRRIWQRRPGRRPYPWLRAAAERAVVQRESLAARGYPADPVSRVQWWSSSRTVRMTIANLTAMGSALDVAVVNPLVDNRFLRALSASLGSEWGRSRAEVLATIGSGRLPASAYTHRAKARFGEVFLRRHTEELIAGWDGSGLLEALVDPAALRAEWCPRPASTATALLLQQLWLQQNH